MGRKESEYCLKSSRIPTPSRFLRLAPPCGRARQRGFTLVETLVGVGILGITVAALCGAFSFGFNTIKLSQEDVRADQILVQKLESVRAYYWAQVTNINYFPTNFPVSYSTTGTVHGITYTGTLAVAPFPGVQTYSDTLRQVTASIWWFSEGQNHTRTMTTLVSQNGIQTYTP